MNIIILDDYQDAVRKLKCASKLDGCNAKVFTNTVKGIGQLSVRLRDADILVLIRERTAFPKQLLEKLPRLKLIAQTGRVGSHVDVDAATRLGIAVAAGVGSPVAPAASTARLTGVNLARRSIRSSNGPEIRFLYVRSCTDVQRHDAASVDFPPRAHGHGFAARTSWKRAG